MPDETLELSPHELYFLPPGTPATAPAERVEVEVDGEMRTFPARLEWESVRHESSEFYSVFFRVEDARHDEILGHQTSVRKEEEDLTEQEIVELMKNAIAVRHAQRYWNAPDVPYQLSIGSEWVTVRWDERNEFAESSLNFRGDLPWKGAQIFSSPRSEFLDLCWQMHEDKSSGVHQALRWAQMKREQRDEIVFRCANGDWAKLHRLFSLALRVLVASYEIPPSPLTGVTPWLFDKELEYHRTLDKYGAMATARRWYSVICNIIRPVFWPDEPSYFWHWRRKWTQQANINTALCGIPTAHEVLEAQLELRDFLRPHLRAEEIEALMRP